MIKIYIDKCFSKSYVEIDGVMVKNIIGISLNVNSYGSSVTLEIVDKDIMEVEGDIENIKILYKTN